MKCPNCDSENFIELYPDEKGHSYILTTVDLTTNPPDFKPNNGRPVNLKACNKCGLAFLFISQKTQ